MWRYLLGGVGALLLAAAGILLFRGNPAVAPLLPALGASDGNAMLALPDSAPEASEATREQRRFNRYDKDKDGSITREEYLANRRKAFARLDLNHDNALQFDEWAAKAEAKFAIADADKSGAMNAAEFATTAVKRKSKPACRCAPVAKAVPAADPAPDADGGDDN